MIFGFSPARERPLIEAAIAGARQNFEGELSKAALIATRTLSWSGKPAWEIEFLLPVPDMDSALELGTVNIGAMRDGDIADAVIEAWDPNLDVLEIDGEYKERRELTESDNLRLAINEVGTRGGNDWIRTDDQFLDFIDLYNRNRTRKLRDGDEDINARDLFEWMFLDGPHMGEGKPASKEYADWMSQIYVGALSDGSVVQFRGLYSSDPTLVIVTPEKQRAMSSKAA